jgi:hypothetical protein
VLARLKASDEATFEPFDPQTQLPEALRRVTPDDLLVVVSARTGSISHHKAVDDIPRSLAQEVAAASFIVIYPEAPEGSKSSEIGHFDVI